MKKIMIFILGLGMITLLLLGCGGKEEETLSGTDNVRIGALKGPTSMGLLFMLEKSNNHQTSSKFEFQMATAADELMALMAQDQLDIALLPANMASILYQKTNGGICVVDINTLGVLYMVSGDTGIQDLADLSGRTVYLTGKGTTPDYVLQYLLHVNGMSAESCVLEYKSEAAEVAALLAQKPDAVGLLPQPFATAACAQNEALQAVLSMNDEWSKAQGEEGSSLVTGVTVVRREFLEKNEAVVEEFLAEHAESVSAIHEDIEKGAALCVKEGIVAKETIAQKAIPDCNITCITGAQMKQALSGYLQALYEQSAQSVGGKLPEEDFYYPLGQ